MVFYRILLIIGFSFAVTFGPFGYCRNAKRSYYQNAQRHLENGLEFYRRQLYNNAYRELDQAVHSALRSDELEALRPDERQRLKELVRAANNEKMRVAEVMRHFRELISEGRVANGMNKEQVLASWGEPRDIDVVRYPWEEIEGWHYGSTLQGNSRYVRFEEGRVVEWNDASRSQRP